MHTDTPHHKTEHYSLELFGPRLIRMSTIEDVDLDDAMAKDIVENAQLLAQGGIYAVLFVTPKMGFSKEAREIFSSSEKRIAVAIVSTSFVSRLVGNFFVKFNKPATPSAVFFDENEAIGWLKEQLKLHA